MARFLRSTAESRLGKPVVVDAAVIFRAVQAQEVAVARAANRQREATHSRLRAPAVVAPAVVFRPVGVNTRVAVWRSVERHPAQHLTPVLGVVGPAVTFTGPPVRMAGSHRLSRRTRYLLRPPTVVSAPAAFVPAPVAVSTRVSVWRAVERHPAEHQTRPPTVVNAAVTFPPPQTRLAPSHRLSRLARSLLRPPATLVPATVFVAPPVNVNTTVAVWRAVEKHPAVHLTPTLGLVNPAVTFGPVRSKLAQTPRQTRTYKSVLRPPATLATAAPPFRAVQVSLTRALPYRRASYKLRPPVVVGQSVTFAPVKVKLVTRPRQAGDSMYRLQPPTILGTVTPPTPPPDTASGAGGIAPSERVKGLTYEEWRRKQDQEEIAIAIALLWGSK